VAIAEAGPAPACPICAGPSRRWLTKAGRDVHRCGACGLIWVPAGLVRTESGASIYEGDDPIFLQEGNDRYYLDETNLSSCRRKLDWMRGLVPRGARVLDAGANFGHFLSVAQAEYRAVGVELSATAVAWSREHFSVDNHAASIYALPDALAGPYDAVTSWDVIEHVPDPREALHQLARVLEPGGTLLLSTPDAGSAVARAMGRYWHYLDPVQHIALFDRANLTRLLKDVGFTIIKTTSFGHFYRVGYVLDRLKYLHGEGLLGRMLPALSLPMRPFKDQKVYINLRDVMGIAARKAG
jgi:2-polyprenyl-3-methyl-5-hydroxy-6-metoxy-1,4-benzoquinol methylase